jgi:YfiH family protein
MSGGPASSAATEVARLPPESLLRPAPGAWPAGSGAAMTTRRGGEGAAPYDTLNMKARPGEADDAAAVARHVARYAATMGARPVWLHQVHGAHCVRVGVADLAPDAPVHAADASVTTERGIACTVLVADCLPVLFASRDARVVGAAHAGWRGLAAGVLETTLATMHDAAGVAPGEVVAWLGACIGPERFEVGDDVRDAFTAAMGEGARARFREAPAREGVRKWWADLPGLAEDRLRAAGVTAVSGVGLCTVGDATRFFSYRREGRTGRMAASAWIAGG